MVVWAESLTLLNCLLFALALHIPNDAKSLLTSSERMLYRKRPVCMQGQTAFWWTCVKFSKPHVARPKHSLNLSLWAATPMVAAGKAGPSWCWYFRQGWLFRKERERRNIKKMVERMKSGGLQWTCEGHEGISELSGHSTNNLVSTAKSSLMQKSASLSPAPTAVIFDPGILAFQ